MARRLEQLQTALGESFPLTSHHATSARRFQLTTLILASLTSAMVGAGVMRVAIASNLPAMPAPVVAAASAPLPVIEPAKPAEIPVAQASRSDEQDITTLLESWRQAWQRHDVSAYLGSYGSKVRPIDGSSRDAWVAARTKKLTSQTPIEVQLRHVVIERVEPTLYQVRFQQDYAAGAYRETARAKTLLVAREDGNWKIVREQQD